MRAAVIQVTSNDDKKANLKKCLDLLDEAINNKADFIALPENFAYLKMEGEAFPFSESLDGEILSRFSQIAKEKKVYILAGSIPEKIEGSEKTYNTSVLFNRSGEKIAQYRKIHLFDVAFSENKVYKESRLVESGKELSIAETEFGKIGLTICYDLRFPELFRQLTFLGSNVIVIPSAFTVNTGKDHWEVLLRARAIENQIYIIAPDQFGKHSDRRSSYGNSMIIDPWGKVLSRAYDKECVIYADLDFEYQNSIRKKLPVLTHVQKGLFNS